jgi:hypothetical protein
MSPTTSARKRSNVEPEKKTRLMALEIGEIERSA